MAWTERSGVNGEEYERKKDYKSFHYSLFIIHYLTALTEQIIVNGESIEHREVDDEQDA